jgi:hypothetical protein
VSADEDGGLIVVAVRGEMNADGGKIGGGIFLSTAKEGCGESYNTENRFRSCCIIRVRLATLRVDCALPGA